jgi:hypothetical protein
MDERRFEGNWIDGRERVEPNDLLSFQWNRYLHNMVKNL